MTESGKYSEKFWETFKKMQVRAIHPVRAAKMAGMGYRQWLEAYREVNKREQQEENTPKKCRHCGKEFIPMTKTESGWTGAEYCCIECSIADPTSGVVGETYYKTCPMCRKDFESHRKGAKFCSDECKKKWGEVMREGSTGNSEKVCQHCGAHYLARYGWQKYCSHTCAREENRLHSKAANRKRKAAGRLRR